jgi:FAD-linked oxidoreductase
MRARVPVRRPELTTWGRTHRWRPAELAAPASLDELVATVVRAGEGGVRVKAIGAGHSFTGVAVTDGVQVTLDRYTGLVDADPTTGRVTLRAGTRLRDVPALLAPYRLAMTNLGDVDVQSIAGAISTGTHGTGARYGGLATQVDALTLILADGSVARCSATVRPDLFAAARVSLGALGVIATVTLRCEPAYLLRAVERPMTYDAQRETFLDRAAVHDHVEFHWFPHTDRTLDKQHTRLPAGALPTPLPRWRAWLDDELVANTLYGAVCGLGAAVPVLVPPLAELSARAVGPRTYADAPGVVLPSPRRVRFRELEYALPRDALFAALDELRALIDRRGWRTPIPVEVRLAAADDVWLSTAHGRDSAYVAVHQYHRNPYRDFLRGAEQVLLHHDGRPHWGKLHTLDASALADRFPRFADFVTLRDVLDPDRRFANVHLARVLGR